MITAMVYITRDWCAPVQSDWQTVVFLAAAAARERVERETKKTDDEMMRWLFICAACE